MPEVRFTLHCLREIAQVHAGCSAGERGVLERALARLAAEEDGRGSLPSHYDPTAPSFLFRADPFVIHYRLADDGAVEFLNVFWQRP